MKDRKQLNLRLDNEGELLEEIKEAAKSQDISLNQFVVNALRSALGQPVMIARQGVDAVLDRLEKVEQRLEALQEQVNRLEEDEDLDNPLTNRVLTLGRLYGMVDQLTALHEIHSQRFAGIEATLNNLPARQALDNKLVEYEEGDLSPKLEPEQQTLDKELDKPLELTPTGKKLYTDAEVAHELDCDMDYIRSIRLGRQNPDAKHSHIREYWEPVKNKAMWRKIKNLS